MSHSWQIYRRFFGASVKEYLRDPLSTLFSFVLPLFFIFTFGITAKIINSNPQQFAIQVSVVGESPEAEALWRQLRLRARTGGSAPAENVGELHQRHGKVVINNAYSRIAWQLARTTLTDDGGADARRDQLKLWLQQVAAPALPLTFSFSGESSNLQAQARLAQHHLCLNEPQQVADDLVLAQIRLCHDAASGLLHFKDQQGQALQPFYLGAVTPMIAWGTKYLLTVLAEPVQIGRPAWSQLMASEQDDDFRHAPRLEEDNCVLIRETWWLRTSRIFREFSGQPVADHPMLLLELLLKQGIPPDSYVNGQYNDSLSWQAFNNDKIRKPMWCRLGNTHCLDQLLLLARKADWLVFREALPAPENSWMQMQENNYVAEIHSEMVISGNNFDLSLMFPEQEKHNA